MGGCWVQMGEAPLLWNDWAELWQAHFIHVPQEPSTALTTWQGQNWFFPSVQEAFDVISAALSLTELGQSGHQHSWSLSLSKRQLTTPLTKAKKQTYQRLGDLFQDGWYYHLELLVRSIPQFLFPSSCESIITPIL